MYIRKKRSNRKPHYVIALTITSDPVTARLAFWGGGEARNIEEAGNAGGEKGLSSRSVLEVAK